MGWIEDYDRLIGAGDVQGAIGVLGEIVGGVSCDHEVLELYAKGLRRLSRGKELEEFCRRHLAGHRHHCSLAVPLAQYLWSVDRIADAWALALWHISQFQELTWGRLMAEELSSRGKFESALQVYSRLFREYPGDPVSHLNCGDCKVKMGDYKGALDAYECAERASRVSKIEIPGLVEYKRALVFKLMGELGRSTEWLRLALKAAPGGSKLRIKITRELEGEAS